MTLFNDSPDWNTSPATGLESTFFQATVNAPGDLVGTHALAGFEQAVLLWQIAGGEVAEMTLKLRGSWLGDSTTEMTTSYIHKPEGYLLVTPLAGLGQFVEIYGEYGTSYPFTVTYSVAFRNGQTFNTMMLGNPWQLNHDANVGATSAVEIYPDVFVPGRHQILMYTTATAWRLYYDWFLGGSGWTSILIASNTNPLPQGFELIAPGSAWRLNFANDDGSARLLTLHGNMSVGLI